MQPYEEMKMKKLNITKERFEKSRYFQNKYGKLEYVSESGKLYKTDKGKVLMFKEESKSDMIARARANGVVTSTSGHYDTFLPRMIADRLMDATGIEDTEVFDNYLVVTFKDGGQVKVTCENI